MATKGQKLTRSNTTTLKITFDTKHLTKMKVVLNQASNQSIKFGWLNRKRYRGTEYRTKGRGKKKVTKNKGLSVAKLAWWLEYGTKNMPPRPMFRQTIKLVRKDVYPHIQTYFKEAFKLNLSQPHLHRMGKVAEKSFDVVIARQNFAPLKPKTIKIKGFDFKLWHSGTLQHNFSYEAVRKNYAKV